MKRTISPDFEKYAMTHSMSGPVTGLRRTLLDLHITPAMTVLDIGCGDGRFLDHIAISVPKNQLFGTEISEIRTARVREKGYSCVHVNSIVLPFPDSFFDVIVFFEVLEHIPGKDVPALLQEFRRVLKPQGFIIGTTPNYPVKRAYDFFRKSKSRIRSLVSGPTTVSRSSKEAPQEATTPHKSRVQRIAFQFSRLFADDPTHQFFCNFRLIHKLGTQYFSNVRLFTTFTDELVAANIHNPLVFFSQKIAFVYVK